MQAILLAFVSVAVALATTGHGTGAAGAGTNGAAAAAGATGTGAAGAAAGGLGVFRGFEPINYGPKVYGPGALNRWAMQPDPFVMAQALAFVNQMPGTLIVSQGE